MSYPPRVVARFDERPRLAALPHGELVGMFVRWCGDRQELAARRSLDGGNSWTEAETVLPLPMEAGHWGGCEVVVDADGEIHALLLNDAGTGVFRDPSGEGEVRVASLYERHLDLWHARTTEGRQRWRAPKCIWQGYTGSLNSALQTSTGRLIVPFSYLTRRTWADRGDDLDAFWYAGQYTSTIVYSDDGGDTWHQSPSQLKVQTPAIGTYGACEPVVVELADGRLWMLIRTQVGRFYESLSADGARWSSPRPTHLINSDSPAGLVRLTDGRLVLLWNKCRRFAYAHGGRHVLHGALSEDEGATWIGHREVARDPCRGAPPPPRGDHGTAYPYPLATPDGGVLVTTGQGAGRVTIVRIDPAWLAEEGHRWPVPGADPREDWSVFGCRGVDFSPVDGDDDGEGCRLTVARTEAEWPAAAVWNFPLSRRGRLELCLRTLTGFGGALLMLTDHFSVPFDPEDVLDAVLAVHLAGPGESAEVAGEQGFIENETQGPRAGGPRTLPPGVARLELEPEEWVELSVEWDLDAGSARLQAAGGEALQLTLRRVTEGLCYLRLKSTAGGPDGGLEVTSAQTMRR